MYCLHLRKEYIVLLEHGRTLVLSYCKHGDINICVKEDKVLCGYIKKDASKNRIKVTAIISDYLAQRTQVQRINVDIRESFNAKKIKCVYVSN